MIRSYGGGALYRPLVVPDPKHCASCGRSFQWRRSMRTTWDEVRYCSAACRRRKVRHIDRDLERTILTLLDAAGEIDATDAARHVGGDDWRDLAEAARRAARRLWVRNEVALIQDGRPVDPDVKGPLRVRRT